MIEAEKLAEISAPVTEKIVGFFSPTKSTAYVVAVFGTFAFCIIDDLESNFRWGLIALLISGVLALAVLLTFRRPRTFSSKTYNDQIHVVRSLNVATSLLALAWSALGMNKSASLSGDFAFFCSLLISVYQIAIFMSYIWLSDSADQEQTINLVQLALITTTFLGGACYGWTQFASHLQSASQAGSDATKEQLQVTATHDLLSALVITALWTWCMSFWSRHLWRRRGSLHR